MELGWNPWAVLRARPHLVLAFAVLSVGCGRIEDYGRGRRRIVLDERLDRRQRSATLGHELVHDELDFVWPPGMPKALVQKGERIVERINAERTIPLGALRAFVDRTVDAEEPVTVELVAEEFDTIPSLAALALTLLPIDGRRAA